MSCVVVFAHLHKLIIVIGLLSVNTETKTITLLTNSDEDGNPIWSANVCKSGESL